MWLVLIPVFMAAIAADLPKTSCVNENSIDWWQKTVIYQIYPRSFKDSDGDGIGDIQGITSKLDYLFESGIKAIWLSPIYKSPMVDFGYDISDYVTIDPIFGSMSDFDALRKKTNDKGIKLILDFVPNHSSDQHEWFQKSRMNDSKYKDYYIWANGRVLNDTYERLPPNNWLSAFGGPAWTWNEDRRQFYLHHYSSGQPDLNYRNPDVVKEMKNVMKFWLDKGVDGFRVDAVYHLFEDKELRSEERSYDPNAQPGDYESLVHNLTSNQPETYDMVMQWRALLDEYDKDGNKRLLMVQIGNSNLNDTMAYYGNKTRPGAHFPCNVDLISKIRKDSNASSYKTVIENWIQNVPAGNWINWAVGNHDSSRVANRMGRGMVDGMNMLALLLPGTAITYYGEEIGMENTFITWEQTVDPVGVNAGKHKYLNRSRDPERTPFQWDDTPYTGFSTTTPWLPLNPNYKTLNLKNDMSSSNSHYSIYKRLVEARQHPVIQRGSFNISILSEDIFSFSRELSGSDALLLIMNLGSTNRTANLSIYKNITENFTVYAASINSSTKLDSTVSMKVTLNPKEALVLTTKDFQKTLGLFTSNAPVNTLSFVSLVLTAICIMVLQSNFIF